MDFSIGFWILLILCSILVFLIGFYIIRREEVEGFQLSKQPTFLPVSAPLPEVFLGNGTFSDRVVNGKTVKALDSAFAYCRSLGAELATFEQLGTASLNGAEWTTGGFLLDRQELYYPCQTTSSFVCSTANQPLTGVSGNAVCYGVKPATGYSNFKANPARYSQFTEFKGVSNLVPEVFLVTTGNDIADQGTASAVCTSLGSNRRLATIGELQAAQRTGLHFCTPGWTSSDASNVFNAVSYYESAYCQNNGVHQLRNIPYNSALGWFDASDPLVGEHLTSGQIPSKFANTPGFNVTGAPTLAMNAPTGLQVLAFTASQTFFMQPVKDPPTSWSIAFVARQTGSNKRILEGLNPDGNGKKGGNYNFGYDEGKKQKFYISGDHVSGSNASTALWDVVLVNYDSSTNAPLSITWNGTNLSIAQPGKEKPFWPLGINMGPSAVNGSCELAELLIYGRAVTSAEQIRILDYLTDKWITKPQGKFIDNLIGASFASPINPRGAICIGPKPFPVSQSNTTYPLRNSILQGDLNLYQTIPTASTIRAFNRDIFSQKYSVVNYTSPNANMSSMSNSLFGQQCTYVSTLGSIIGSGFWLCETDNAAKYLYHDTSIGPYDQICVFMGDRKNVSYSCKDNGKFAQNPDMIRYQSADDFRTFCDATARLFVDLSGAYGINSDITSTTVNSVSTMSSMQQLLGATSTLKCATGKITSGNCVNINIVLGQVSASISTLKSEIGVLNGISTISSLKGTVFARRKEFQCFNFGVEA